jgi:hypothetical protein
MEDLAYIYLVMTEEAEQAEAADDRACAKPPAPKPQKQKQAGDQTEIEADCDRGHHLYPTIYF